MVGHLADLREDDARECGGKRRKQVANSFATPDIRLAETDFGSNVIPPCTIGEHNRAVDR